MTATTSDHPLVSIITPIYNTPKELFLACKNSVLNQTLTDFEWLLLDDGSDDDTVAMLDEAGHEDPRMHVYHLPHGGVSKARNFGLDICKGRYITFVDADDTVEPIFLEHASHAMQSNNADIAIGRLSDRKGKHDAVSAKDCSGKSLFLNGNALKKFIRYTLTGYPILPHTAQEYFSARPFPVAPRMYRKSIVENVRFDTRMTISEDSLFGTEALERSNRVVLMDELWYHYISHAASTIHKHDISVIVEQMRSFDIYCERMREYDWEASDIGMRFCSATISRFRSDAGYFRFGDLMKCLRNIYKLDAAAYCEQVDFRIYSMKPQAKLARWMVARKLVFLTSLALKFPSLRRK